MKSFKFLILCASIILLITSCSQSPSQSISGQSSLTADSSQDRQDIPDQSALETPNQIKTDYFTLEFPQNWKDLYSWDMAFDESMGDWTLHVNMTSKNKDESNRLFAIYLLSTANAGNIATALDGWVEPLGVLSGELTGEEYLLAYSYASEMACSEDEQDTFLELTDSVPQVIDSITPAEGFWLVGWDDDVADMVLSSYDDIPCVPISFKILGSDFQSYQNQSGSTFFLQQNAGVLNAFHVNASESTSYYYDTDTFVGVENGVIVLYSFLTETPTPSVRDMINELGGADLFDVTPNQVRIDGDTVSFYHWAIDGGYIGFVAAGGSDPSKCYGYKALQFIAYQDPSLLNIL